MSKFKKVLLMSNQTFNSWKNDMNINAEGEYYKFDIKTMPDIQNSTKTVVPPKIKINIDVSSYNMILYNFINGWG